jgi:phosphosulfolactate synthase (CoM biosynthesis protein A)
MGEEEGKETQTKGIDNLFNNIIAEISSNVEKGRDNQIQEAFRIPNRQGQKRNTPRYIIIKTLNIQNKEIILKAAKEKQQVTFKGKPMRLIADFST